MTPELVTLPAATRSVSETFPVVDVRALVFVMPAPAALTDTEVPVIGPAVDKVPPLLVALNVLELSKLPTCNLLAELSVIEIAPEMFPPAKPGSSTAPTRLPAVTLAELAPTLRAIIPGTATVPLVIEPVPVAVMAPAVVPFNVIVPGAVMLLPAPVAIV